MDAQTVSLLTLVGSIAVQIIGVLMTNRLLTYRVDQLEKEMQIFGNTTDRVDALEVKVTYNEKALDRLTNRVEG